MTRILITGSLGYIGSVLSSHLQGNGYQCIGFDTGFFKDEFLYPAGKTQTVLKDARDLMEADFVGIDAVVHLAGISNDPVGNLEAGTVYDPTRDYSLKIALICKKLGIRFIFASSCSVYGIGGDAYLDENSPTNPQTHYSTNKLQIEEDLARISDESFSPIALRFATIFGASPRIRFDVVINMLVGMAVSGGKIILNSDGKAWRPNLHIIDACEAIRCAIELNYDGGELLILNIGSDENNLQIIDIAKIIQQTVPDSQLKFLNDNPDLDPEGLIRDRKISKGSDVRTYLVSFEKTRSSMPQFKCEWGVKRGVRDLVDELTKIDFDEKVFRSRGFYRLQHLEDLHGGKKIADDLRWVSVG